MNVDAGAVVKFGSGITVYGDKFQGPGKSYFTDFNWSSTPSVRTDDEPRQQADGDFPPQSFLEAKDLVMVGFLVETTHTLKVAAMEKLKRLRLRTVRMTVFEPGQKSWADVEIREIEIDDSGFAPEATFRIRMRQPDPRKIGPAERVFASGERAFHRGNYPSIPEVTVTGAMSGYRVNGPDGKRYIVTQALTAGHEHRLDFETGWLYLDGELQQGAVSRAETWTIPPGPGVVMTLVPDSGSGTLAVRPPYTAT